MKVVDTAATSLCNICVNWIISIHITALS